MNSVSHSDPDTDLYHRDFHAWAMHNARLIRQGRFTELDMDNIAEELESMGRSEKRELTHRLAVLIAHLLKWRHQPERRGRSWQLTIAEQRRRTARVLRDNPSLRSAVEAILSDAYGDALLRAGRETGLSRDTFPGHCPYTLAQLLDETFLPDDS